MATQLMKDWIVELHNPERKQTQGLLGRRTAEGVQSNCCLGVLCEVDGIEPRESLTSDGDYTLIYAEREGMPPSSLIAKVLDKDPTLWYSETVELYEDEDGDGYEVTIVADEANDTHGLSFEEIADKLSERYLNAEEQFEVRKRIEDLGWA